MAAVAEPAGAQRAPLETGLDTQVREERYVLELDRLDQVIDSMNVMRLEGPQSPMSQGLTEYRINPEWRYRPDDEGCAVVAARVGVDITVTLPEWAGARGAPARDRIRWQEIVDAVRTHEYAHRDLVLDAGGQLLERLQSLRAGTCTGLIQAAEGVVAIADAELNRAHAELDGR